MFIITDYTRKDAAGNTIPSEKDELKKLSDDGICFKEEKPCFYIYRQIMGDVCQTGLVGCAGVDDYINNVIKNSYMGCCMAFDRRLLKRIMPIPRYIPMHDQWIGLMGEIYGKVILVDTPLIYYRVHGDNVTAGKEEASLQQKLRWRRYLVKKLIGRTLFKK